MAWCLPSAASTTSPKGLVDANIDVSGAGGSVRQIMAGLNGSSRIVTKDGKLESGALNIVSTDLTSIFNSADDKKIICGVIDHRITKGMANTHALVFETGGISVVGTGAANLADETLKMRVEPRAKKPNIASRSRWSRSTSKGTFAKPGLETRHGRRCRQRRGAVQRGSVPPWRRAAFRC